MEKGIKRLKLTPLKGQKLVAKKSDPPRTKDEFLERYNKLKAQEERLDKEIAELESQGVDSNLKPQMEALHEYNEMKDAAQVVLGYIADIEQVTIAEVHKRYNVSTN